MGIRFFLEEILRTEEMNREGCNGIGKDVETLVNIRLNVKFNERINKIEGFSHVQETSVS